MLLLNSSSCVAILRICSTTLVRLLHGFGLLPSGISGSAPEEYREYPNEEQFQTTDPQEDDATPSDGFFIDVDVDK